MIQFRFPNGDLVPVPDEVHAKGDVAVQGFYDGQAQRVAVELGISVEDLHSQAFAKDPAGFVAAKKAVPATAPAQPAGE